MHAVPYLQAAGNNTPLRADRSPLKEDQKTWGAQQIKPISK
jgi:hypothetical protein